MKFAPIFARLPVALTLVAAVLGGPPAALDPTVRKMVAEISPERIGSSVATLAGFGTRGNYSNPGQQTRGIGAARRWIEAQFHNCGPRLKVTEETGRSGTTEIVNVIGVLPGVTAPEKRILVTAHYDSINLTASRGKAAEAPAPGADDNASGTAVVLELARVLSQYRFSKTIVFIAFAGEEVGLLGSTRYAAAARTGHEQIEAVLDNDAVGSNVLGKTTDFFGIEQDSVDADGDTGNRLNIYSPDPSDGPSRRLAREIQDAAGRYVPGLRIELVPQADRFGREGDQIPFQKNGYAAVRFTSASENTSVEHTEKDIAAGVSATFAAGVARFNAAAIAGLAVPAR